VTDKIQTGVGFLICAAHADKVTGAVHGHTYEVVAWFDGGHDAEKLKAHCERLCADLDHATLPAALAWAEDLIPEIKRRTNAVDVEIRRPLERLYARTR
jgi:6-pyruvoyl-tetrahydropterin synthase